MAAISAFKYYFRSVSSRAVEPLQKKSGFNSGSNVSFKLIARRPKLNCLLQLSLKINATFVENKYNFLRKKVQQNLLYW